MTLIWKRSERMIIRLFIVHSTQFASAIIKVRRILSYLMAKAMEKNPSCYKAFPFKDPI